METFLKIPFYARALLIVIGLYFLIDVLYIARAIIIPVAISTIIAILLSPAINFLIKRKMNRVLAIAIILIMAIIIIAGLGALVVSQAIHFRELLPKLIDKLHELLNQFTGWVSGYLNISKEEISKWLINVKGSFLNNNSMAIRNTLSGVGSALVIFLLAPFYVFIILYYQPFLVDFVYKISGVKNSEKVKKILAEINATIQGYLSGLIIEMAIIATLNSIGLLILGIRFAILLGIMGALLNLIPYLGNVIAMVIYIMIALVTKDSPLFVLYILLMYAIIQIIDNNFIIPKIVGAKVKLNALASFIAVIIGGVLWGAAGMFLAIPLSAIIKIACDHVESLKPYGFLLGDARPSLSKNKALHK